MRVLSRVVLVVAVLVCCVPLAFASTPPASAVAVSSTTVQTSEALPLALDPFLSNGVVTTSIPMAVRCPCHVFTGCGGLPVGYDCAEPVNCCHCAGVDPSTRLCVANVN